MRLFRPVLNFSTCRAVTAVSTQNVSSPAYLSIGARSDAPLTVLQNRAFQKVTPGSSVSAWGVTSGASMAVVADSSPVSSSLPNSLALTVSSTASGEVGVYNTGYTGTCRPSGCSFRAGPDARDPQA